MFAPLILRDLPKNAILRASRGSYFLLVALKFAQMAKIRGANNSYFLKTEVLSEIGAANISYCWPHPAAYGLAPSTITASRRI
jgi:hypothetical protein